MRIHKVVFYTSAAIILLFVGLTALFTDWMAVKIDNLQSGIVSQFGWFYILSVSFFLGFVLWMFFSKFGRVKLGQDDDEPEYSYASWFAMLFTAGMGIGLIFFSVAEPVWHFANPPDPELASPSVTESGEISSDLANQKARAAMTLTYFHWGLHAWAIYIVVAIALGYYGYRHGLPLTIRSTLYPLIGNRIHGWMGNTVDIIAVCGTMFGVATSLGLGVMQINAGLEYVAGIEQSIGWQLGLIAGITAVATISVVLGLDGGIRRLSQFAIIAAGILMLVVFLAGRQGFILASFVQSLGDYAQNLFRLSFHTDAYQAQQYEEGLNWQKDWTMFYWGWWISWSPFVGMFLARISRGRTVREFIGAVLFIPTLVTFIWMSVFGGSALHSELFGDGGIIKDDGSIGFYTSLFEMLDQLPLALVTSWLAILAIFAFFVTSSDSGSLVIDIITAGGDDDPPVGQRIFWAVTEGVVAAMLLLIGYFAVQAAQAAGEEVAVDAGLKALQTAAITSALPFTIVILITIWGLVRAFHSEHPAALTAPDLPRDNALPADSPSIGASAEQAVPGTPEATSRWKDRLGELTREAEARGKDQKTLDEAWEAVDRFIREVAEPVMQEMKQELESKGRRVSIDRGKHTIHLDSSLGGGHRFQYRVEGHAYKPFSFAPNITDKSRTEHQKPAGRGGLAPAKAVIQVGHGNLHALRSWSREALINDFLKDYARWVNW